MYKEIYKALSERLDFLTKTHGTIDAFIRKVNDYAETVEREDDRIGMSYSVACGARERLRRRWYETT